MHAKGNQINTRCYAFNTTLFPEKYYEIWKFRINNLLMHAWRSIMKEWTWNMDYEDPEWCNHRKDIFTNFRVLNLFKEHWRKYCSCLPSLYLEASNNLFIISLCIHVVHMQLRFFAYCVMIVCENGSSLILNFLSEILDVNE